VLAATLASTGTIPVASVALVLGIHRLMSQGLTPTNLIGNTLATIVVAKWENALDEERLHRMLDGGPVAPASAKAQNSPPGPSGGRRG
jgi:aerobic C4-dicarboxylate transport protein